MLFCLHARMVVILQKGPLSQMLREINGLKNRTQGVGGGGIGGGALSGNCARGNTAKPCSTNVDVLSLNCRGGSQRETIGNKQNQGRPPPHRTGSLT